MNHQQHQTHYQRSRKGNGSFRRSLLAIGLITLLILSGCGSAAEPTPVNPPTITRVEVNGTTIGILASDDKGVVGYIVTKTNTIPALNDAMWKDIQFFTVAEEGTYYVWVKDTEDNISEYKEVLVVIDDPIARLAPDYDHLAWYLDNSPTKTVDGKEYDLNALRQQYGDLYRFVEPLSQEEVEQRFEYIVRYLIDGGQMVSYGSGIKETTISQDFHTKIYDLTQGYWKYIHESSDPNISKFSGYYEYFDRLERYVYNSPNSFDSEETRFGLGLDNLNRISIVDKDWYVRHHVTEVDLSLKLVKELGIEIQFWFDSK